MTKTFYALTSIFVLALIGGALLFIMPAPAETPEPVVEQPYADLITVDAPQPNAQVGLTTLTATGKARGYWYFEASFPVALRDQSGATIAQAPAQAQGEWMTEEFVPFSVTLTYPPQPAGSTGTLVLRNDNPSGEPANDKQIEVPVVFQ